MQRGPTLVFESTAFAFVEGEEDETSPGVFGQALAEWMRGKLEGRGVKTTMFIGEDYGLLVGIVSDPHKLYVACANADDTQTLWKVFVEAERVPTSPGAASDKSMAAIDELHRSVKEILSTDPAVKFLRQQA